jgi:hypothetical protein
MMAKMTPEDMRPSDVITERSKFDPYIGKMLFYPGCDVNIVPGQRYDIGLVDFEVPRFATFAARRCVDFKHDRRWIMDPCCPHADRLMFLWVSKILDQIGNVIILGMPWNYDKFYDEQTLLVAA